MKTFKNILRITTLLIASVAASFAADASAYDLPAVGGYDLVSYHQDGGPIRGSGFQKAEHAGITYLFANEANKAAFEANPRNTSRSLTATAPTESLLDKNSTPTRPFTS